MKTAQKERGEWWIVAPASGAKEELLEQSRQSKQLRKRRMARQLGPSS